MIKKKINISFILLWIMLLVFIVLEYILFDYKVLQIDSDSIYFLKFELLVVYVLVIFTTKQRIMWKNIYFFYLLGMGIFLFGRIFLDIFHLSPSPFNYATKWCYFYFSNTDSVKLLFLFIFTLIIVNIGFLFRLYSVDSSIKTQLQFSPKLYIVGVMFFLIGLPIFLFKLYFIILYSWRYGYDATYVGQGLQLPFWTKGAGTITLIAYSFILGSLPSRRAFFFFSFLFIISQIGVLLEGARGGFVITLMIIIWYYYNVYSYKDILLKKFSILALFIIILSQITVTIRAGENFTNYNILSFFTNFIYAQGTSIQVPFWLIAEPKTHSVGIPYILYPLISLGVLSPSQNLDTLHTYNILGHHLTYFISPKAYLSGEGTGSSFVAQLYDLPRILMILLLFFLGYFIAFFNKIIKQKRIWLILSYTVAFSIIWMPRGDFFPNINFILPIIIIYLLSFLLKGKSYD